MGCVSSGASREKGQFFYAYKLGKKLGEGAYGQVRVAQDRNTGHNHAVKIIDVRGRDDKGQLTNEIDWKRTKVTRAEVSLWQQVGKHEFCVELIRAFLDKSLCYLVMEMCQGGSIMDKLVGMQQMTRSDLSRIFRQMLQGIAHVHEVGVVHRDIKPDNFLFGGPDGLTVKLCDFGLATQMPKKGLLKGVYGTPPYMSPEMLAHTGYDFRTDAWSLGATAHLMFYGAFPYTPSVVTPAAMKQAILSDTPKLVITGEDSLTLFIQGLLRRTPADRCTAAQALELPFVSPAGLPSPRGSLTTALHQARKLSRTLKKPVNPTVQKNLDELLLKLGRSTTSNGVTVHFFSETEAQEEDGEAAPDDTLEDRIRVSRRRSQQRHSTHSGVVSEAGTSPTSSRSPMAPLTPRSPQSPQTPGASQLMSAYADPLSPMSLSVALAEMGKCEKGGGRGLIGPIALAL